MLLIFVVCECLDGLWNNSLINQLAEEKEVLLSDQSQKNYDAEIESFRALAGDQDAEMLKAFVDQIGSGVEVDIEPIVLSPSSDKSHRTVSCERLHMKISFTLILFLGFVFVLLLCMDAFRQCITFSKRDWNSWSLTQ